MPAMLWITLCSDFGKGSEFFRDIYPCNFNEDMENLLKLDQYITLMRDTDHVYLDLVCETQKLTYLDSDGKLVSETLVRISNYCSTIKLTN